VTLFSPLSRMNAWAMTLCWGLGFIVMPAAVMIAIGLVMQFMLERRPLDGLYDIAEHVGWCGKVTRAEPVDESGVLS
jgi:hypothetical protein